MPNRSSAATPVPFNRLFVPPDKRVSTLKEDGIHDPNSPAIGLLQEPKQAFLSFEKSTSGNNVDWVKTLKKKTIRPLYDRDDPKKAPMPMDLNIVMEVKGTMPDVVFEHGKHVEWLDCANCHPEIFMPQKGANQISMAQIMLGQSCGVCHGSVAFPATECRKCHSQEKVTSEK